MQRDIKKLTCSIFTKKNVLAITECVGEATNTSVDKIIKGVVVNNEVNTCIIEKLYCQRFYYP